MSRTVTLRRPTTLGSPWTRAMQIGYGPAIPELGTSGGEEWAWGPEYGVQLPDGTWWYADAAKLRLAHYSNAGAYLGQLKLPASHLSEGGHFPWANPIALADGTLVLTGTTVGSPELLLLSPTYALSRVRLPRPAWFLVTDGARLYGFDDAGAKVRVNPRTGSMATTSRFRGQGGRRFTINTGSGFIEVQRPGVRLHLDLVDPEHPSVPVNVSIEAVVGADGTLWILAMGITELSIDEVHEVVGLFGIDPSGAVSPVSPVRTWYSESDPGDGHHLGMRYGGNEPTLMFVDNDAVRVYRKK